MKADDLRRRVAELERELDAYRTEHVISEASRTMWARRFEYARYVAALHRAIGDAHRTRLRAKMRAAEQRTQKARHEYRKWERETLTPHYYRSRRYVTKDWRQWHRDSAGG